MRVNPVDAIPHVLVLVALLLTGASVWLLLFLPILFLLGVVARNLAVIMFKQLPHGLGKKDAPEFVLESLPVSPFVEKTRWVLDRLGANYVEEIDYGVVMWIRGASVPSLHFCRPGSWALSTISNSRDIVEYLAGRFHGTPAAAFLQVSAGNGADDLEALTDEIMVTIRRLFYHHVLVSDGGAHAGAAKQLWGLADARVPAWQSALASLMLPLQRAMLTQALGLAKPGCRDKCMARLRDLFAQFQARLDKSPKNKTLLDTPEPTKFDLFLAVAVAIATESPEYVKICPTSFGASLTRAIPNLAADIAELSRHPLAKWATDMYVEHRRK